MATIVLWYAVLKKAAKVGFSILGIEASSRLTRPSCGHFWRRLHHGCLPLRMGRCAMDEKRGARIATTKQRFPDEHQKQIVQQSPRYHGVTS
jgi:hypothetical protein